MGSNPIRVTKQIIVKERIVMSRTIEHTGKVESRGSELTTPSCSTLGSLLPFTTQPHSLTGLKVASRGETTGVREGNDSIGR